MAWPLRAFNHLSFLISISLGFFLGSEFVSTRLPFLKNNFENKKGGEDSLPVVPLLSSLGIYLLLQSLPFEFLRQPISTFAQKGVENSIVALIRSNNFLYYLCLLLFILISTVFIVMIIDIYENLLNNKKCVQQQLPMGGPSVFEQYLSIGLLVAVWILFSMLLVVLS